MVLIVGSVYNNISNIGNSSNSIKNYNSKSCNISNNIYSINIRNSINYREYL